MTTNKPETPANAPATTVVFAPSDTLLKTYRLNIQAKWEKFDTAVPALGKSMPAYTQAKAQYMQSMQLLNNVANDTDLKRNGEILAQIDATITGLTTHLIALSESEKKEAYNLALADMRNTLADFKGEITGKKELADVARNPQSSANNNVLSSLESATPTITTAVAGVGTAIVGTGLMSEKGWKKTLAEGFGKFKDWIASFFDEDSMFGSLLGGMKDKIMGIFTAIGAKLGIKPKEGEKPEGNSILTHLEKSNGEKGAKKVFEKLDKEKKVSSADLQVYYTHPNILSRSRAELKSLYTEGKNSPAKLAKDLGFEESKGSLVYDAIGLLLSEHTIEKMKGFGVKDAENIPIGRLFSSMTKYMELLDTIKSKGKDLEKKDMSFGNSVSIDGAKEFIGDKKVTLEALRERFSGFSPQILSIVHSAYSRKGIDEIIDLSPYKNELADNEDGKKFLEETLPNYAKTLPTLVRSFSFGSPAASEAIEQYIKEQGLKYDDLIDIFILSGGHTTMEEMNAVEKSQVIMRIFLMIREGKGSEAYKYGGAIFTGLLSKDSKIVIPEDVKMVLHDIGDIFKNAALFTLTELKDMVVGMAKLNPWLTTGAGATIAGVLWLAIKLTPVGRVASTFLLLLTGLGVGTLAYAGYKITDDGKVTDIKTGKVELDVEQVADEERKIKK